MVVRELIATPQARTDVGRYRWAAGLAVVLALSSVATHAWMLVAMPMAPAVHVVVLAMAAACLWCGIRLLRTPRVHEWVMTAVMGAAMVGTHLLMTGSAAGHESTGTGMRPDPATGWDPMSMSMALAMAEIGVAVAVLWRMTMADPVHGRIPDVGVPGRKR